MSEINWQEAAEEKREDTNEDGYGYTENLYEEMERELCKKCKRRRIDRSENPESILCKECREELIKLKVPPVMIVTGILVLAIVGICLLSFGVKCVLGGHKSFLLTNRGEIKTEVFEESESDTDDEDDTDYGYDTQEPAAKAETGTGGVGKGMVLTTECKWALEYAEAGYVVTGLDQLLAILEENPQDMNAAVVTVDLAMKHAYPDYAAYTIENFLAGKTVSDEIYERISDYIDKLDIYYETVDKAAEIWNQAEETWGGDSMEAFRECHDGIAACLGDETYDQAYLNYVIADVCLDDEAERVEHLKNCLAIDDNYGNAKAQLGVYYRRKGELDKSRQLLEAGYQNNREVYSLTRALAALELAENHLEQGLIYAEEAYHIYPEGEYAADTYIIALTANGQTQEADRLTEELEEQGYSFDDDFYAFRKGEMTLEEYYYITGEEEE